LVPSRELEDFADDPLLSLLLEGKIKKALGRRNLTPILHLPPSRGKELLRQLEYDFPSLDADLGTHLTPRVEDVILGAWIYAASIFPGP
jgi:hypothetical protein